MKKLDAKKVDQVNKTRSNPAFAARGLRAFRRVSKKVRAENRALGLPLLLGKNGKVIETPA